ncbi:MAG: DUF4252 domain-containing protein [Lewinellaceae bacterium]|nr:DUF4252 domain-containing protein [Lewinellaceae bacterium]
MKSLFSIIFTLSFISISFGQDAIEKLFNDYQNNADFKVVYVAPKMFQMVAKMTSESDQNEFKEIVKDLKGLRILSTEKNPQQIYTEANKRLAIKEYEELITVKEKGSNVRFVTKETNGKISELLLLVGSASEFTMISFVGNIDLNKISKLASKLNIEGAEHLDKVKK